jgi:hypothetical protein
VNKKTTYQLEIKICDEWIRTEEKDNIIVLEVAEKLLHDKGFQARVVKIKTGRTLL